MNWIRQYEERGPGSFFAPRNTRGGAVMTEEVKARCAMLLAQGKSVAEVARLTSVNSSTLRKAIQAGALCQPLPVQLIIQPVSPTEIRMSEVHIIRHKRHVEG